MTLNDRSPSFSFVSALVLAGVGAGAVFTAMHFRTRRLERKLDALAHELAHSRPAVTRVTLPMPELGRAPTDDAKLEEGLRESFPASDSPSVTQPKT